MDAEETIEALRALSGHVVQIIVTGSSATEPLVLLQGRLREAVARPAPTPARIPLAAFGLEPFAPGVRVLVWPDTVGEAGLSNLVQLTTNGTKVAVMSCEDPAPAPESAPESEATGLDEEAAGWTAEEDAAAEAVYETVRAAFNRELEAAA